MSFVEFYGLIPENNYSEYKAIVVQSMNET